MSDAVRPSPRWLPAGILSLQALSLLATGLGFWCLADENGAWLLPRLRWAFLAQALWHALSWRAMAGSFFDLYGLFTGVVVLCHAASVPPARPPPTPALTELYAEGMFLALLSFASLQLGALSRAWGAERPPERSELREPGPWVRRLGWALFLGCLVPTIICLVFCLFYAQTRGYSAALDILRDPDFQLFGRISRFFPPACLILLVSFPKGVGTRTIATTALLSFGACWLYVGSRERGFFPLLALVWLWSGANRLSRTTSLLLGLAAFLILAPSIAEMRSKPRQDPFSRSFWQNFWKLDQDRVERMVEYVGSQIVPATYSLASSPGVVPHDRGVHLAKALYGGVILPFSGPSMNQSLSWNETRLTYAVHPEQFEAARRGAGYSILAETYTSFGWVCAPIFLYLLGWILAHIHFRCAASSRPSSRLLVALLLLHLPLWSRQGLYQFSDHLVWVVLIPFLIVRGLELRGAGPDG